MIKAILINLFFSIYCFGFSQLNDEELLRSIRHDDTVALKNYFLKKNDPNRLYGKIKVPLIHYAASIDKSDAISVIIKAGGNIEKVFLNETPLMTASYYGQENAADLLIKSGANINFQNNKGKTAAIFSAQYNQYKILEMLFQNGADLCLKDCTGNAPIDYAYKLQNIESYNFLADNTYNQYDAKALPNYIDGPYVFYLDNNRLSVKYIVNDSLQNRCYLNDSIIHTQQSDISLNKKGQRFKITLKNKKSNSKIKDKYTNVSKIMAIGDLHGDFDTFSSFLINNKIVDENFNWTFGNGHLVLIGDIFDRGSKVTECFWLLYKLEAEAEMNHGKVHVILGNHEIMELSGDKRYLADKYLDLFNRLRLDYTSFYGKDTEIGKWLRTQNSILQLNDILFVHGGISPELLEKKYSISYINQKIRTIIERQKPETMSVEEEFLLGTYGPLWYRGYLKLSENYYRVTGEKFDFNENKLDEILQFYKVNRIVFANTNVREVSPMYHNKLFGIDIPFSEQNIELQGLFIDKTGIFIAHDTGQLEMIK